MTHIQGIIISLNLFYMYLFVFHTNRRPRLIASWIMLFTQVPYGIETWRAGQWGMFFSCILFAVIALFGIERNHERG